MNLSTFKVAAGIVSAVALSGAAALAFPPPPASLPITIEWETLDCGAETLSAGDLVLEGTFGQFDAGHESEPLLADGPGGPFSFVGGFWGDDGDSQCIALQSNPAPVVVCAHGSVTFSVAPAGTPPFGYVWRKGQVPIDAAQNRTAATPTLQLANVSAADAGQYDCVVTNSCGTITSSTAKLSVGYADLGSQGGIPGSDGFYDNNDFVVFITYFFSQEPAADVGSQGGLLGSDGAFDNNDFIIFIDQFFEAC